MSLVFYAISNCARVLLIFIMMKTFAKCFILINLLVYCSSEKEVHVLVNEDKYRTNSRRCFLIPFDTVISPNCLYEPPLVLMQNVKTLYTLYSERKPKLNGDVETNPGPQVNFTPLTNLSRNNNNYLKIFHVNAQSLI